MKQTNKTENWKIKSTACAKNVLQEQDNQQQKKNETLQRVSGIL